MSLMEPERKRRLYIAEQFDAEQRCILTSDKLSASSAWYVYFFNGYCNVNHVFILYYVRAVR